MGQQKIMHYYKFNIADWALHTAHLQPEEEGIYLRLLNHYYDTEEPIEEEKTHWVCRRLRLGNHVEAVGLILEEFFTLVDGFWHHKRCEMEITAYQEQVEKNRENAKRGGRPKGSGHKQKQQKNPVASQSQPSGVNLETLTTNHKPLTINHKGVELPESSEEFQSVCREFIDHRRNIKKPLTQNAFDRFLTACAKAGGEMDLPVERVIQEVIDAGWAGIKTEWLRNRLGQAPRASPQGSTRQNTLQEDLTDTSWAH
jgi:uncharacterized protein YdaU (DUF1376 family)